MSTIRHTRHVAYGHELAHDVGRARHRVAGIIVAATAALVLWAAIGVGIWALVSGLTG